jgi:hypothetical protein
VLFLWAVANWQRRFKPMHHHVAGAGNHALSSIWRAINGCRTSFERDQCHLGLRSSTIRATSRRSVCFASASSNRRYVMMCCCHKPVRGDNARGRNKPPLSRLMPVLANFESELHLHYRPGLVSDLNRHLVSRSVGAASDGISCHVGQCAGRFLLQASMVRSSMPSSSGAIWSPSRISK